MSDGYWDPRRAFILNYSIRRKSNEYLVSRNDAGHLLRNFMKLRLRDMMRYEGEIETQAIPFAGFHWTPTCCCCFEVTAADDNQPFNRFLEPSQTQIHPRIFLLFKITQKKKLSKKGKNKNKMYVYLWRDQFWSRLMLLRWRHGAATAQTDRECVVAKVKATRRRRRCVRARSRGHYCAIAHSWSDDMNHVYQINLLISHIIENISNLIIL